jgi:hypothetical protein
LFSIPKFRTLDKTKISSGNTSQNPQPQRLFSTAGQLADDKRSKLLPENLEKLLFLRENILVMNFDLDWD